MSVLLKVYLTLAAGVVVLIAAVTIPIAVCNAKRTASVKDAAATPQTAFRKIGQTSDGELLLAAIHFLVSRKMQGELPGIAADERVAIDFPWLVRGTNDGTWHFAGTNLGNYPVRLTFTMHAASSDNRFCYSIGKISTTTSWQLEKAWLSDTNDRVVKEFSIY